MKLTLIIGCALLTGAGCVNHPVLRPATSSLTVVVPSSVESVSDSFSLVPTITLKNTTGAPLLITFTGSEPTNVTLEFDVYDAKGQKLVRINSRPLYFLGGGRIGSESLRPDDSWVWKSHYADTYPESQGSRHSIVARVSIDGREFVSEPSYFFVSTRRPNQVPLPTAASSTPAADAPVVPPPGAAGL
jgi:hypothetical protein